jgi:preprotein translocase subunit SecA
MLDAIKEESVGFLFNVEVEIQQPATESAADAAAVPAADGAQPAETPAPATPPAAPAVRAKGLTQGRPDTNLQYSAPTLDSTEPEKSSTAGAAVSGGEPGRNAPCPCGSGKKYKRCHGAPAAAR